MFSTYKHIDAFELDCQDVIYEHLEDEENRSIVDFYITSNATLEDELWMTVVSKELITLGAKEGELVFIHLY